MKPLLLATQSRYKIALFQRLGLPFQTAAPPFEESMTLGEKPGPLAERLALGKAESLVDAFPHHCIVGADQVLELDGHIFSKPGTTGKAVEQLLALAGKTHRLHTGFALLDPESGDRKQGLVTSELKLHAGLREKYLHRLVIRDQSQDCVGGYKFESLGIALFEWVRTPDPNAIVGLPLLALTAVLRERGYFSPLENDSAWGSLSASNREKEGN